MIDSALLGPWVRRFLLEHLVGERGLARNTQQSYRDTLRLLLPFTAERAGKAIDRLAVEDIRWPGAGRFDASHSRRRLGPWWATWRRRRWMPSWQRPM